MQLQRLDPSHLEAGRGRVVFDRRNCWQPAAGEDLGQDELSEVNDLVKCETCLLTTFAVEPIITPVRVSDAIDILACDVF